MAYIALGLVVYLFIGATIWCFQPHHSEDEAVIFFWPIRFIKWFFKTLWKEITQ